MGKEGTKEKLDIELEAPADFTSPEVLYQDLVKTILPGCSPVDS